MDSSLIFLCSCSNLLMLSSNSDRVFSCSFFSLEDRDIVLPLSTALAASHNVDTETSLLSLWSFILCTIAGLFNSETFNLHCLVGFSGVKLIDKITSYWSETVVGSTWPLITL